MLKLAKQEEIKLIGRSHTFGLDVTGNLAAFHDRLKKFIDSGEVEALYLALHYLRQIKKWMRDINNLNHELVCLAAKHFLQQRHPDVNWSEVDFAKLDVNAPGMDLLVEQAKVVGMVKTTEPKLATAFGANQKKNIEADLKKLSSAQYDGWSRYMFVTCPKAHYILTKKYVDKFPEICFVLLGNARRQDVVGGARALEGGT